MQNAYILWGTNSHRFVWGGKMFNFMLTKINDSHFDDSHVDDSHFDDSHFDDSHFYISHLDVLHFDNSHLNICQVTK